MPLCLETPICFPRWIFWYAIFGRDTEQIQVLKNMYCKSTVVLFRLIPPVRAAFVAERRKYTIENSIVHDIQSMMCGQLLGFSTFTTDVFHPIWTCCFSKSQILRWQRWEDGLGLGECALLWALGRLRWHGRFLWDLGTERGAQHMVSRIHVARSKRLVWEKILFELGELLRGSPHLVVVATLIYKPFRPFEWNIPA